MHLTISDRYTCGFQCDRIDHLNLFIRIKGNSQHTIRFDDFFIPDTEHLLFVELDRGVPVQRVADIDLRKPCVNVSGGSGIEISNRVVSANYGTGNDTVCRGNDTRLSDARPASDVYTWAKQPSKPSYTPSEIGAVSNNDTRLSNSRPASDVYSWAKASSKPSYTASEVGAVAKNGDTVTGTLNMSSAPTNKINLGVLSLTGSASYVGFGNGDFKFRVGADGAITSFGAFLISTGQIRADGSYTTTVAESANVNIGSTGYFRRSTSSLRYKDCVEDVEDELMQAVIDNIRPIWYRSLCKDDDRSKSYWGLGAEELGAIDPRFVHWAHPIAPTEIVEQVEFQEPTGEVDENGVPITQTVTREERRIENRPDATQPVQAEGVMYDRLVIPLLWHAKKLQAKIETLEQRLSVLENK